MEKSHHLSTKLKSSYLMTLIFSYLEYYDSLIDLIRLLSKAGKIFLQNNEEQLEFFCNTTKSIRREKIQLSMAQRFVLVNQPCKIVLNESRVEFRLEEPPKNPKYLENIIRFQEKHYNHYKTHPSEEEIEEVLQSSQEILSKASYFEFIIENQFGFLRNNIFTIQRVLLEINKLHLKINGLSYREIVGALQSHKTLIQLKLSFKENNIFVDFFTKFSFQNLLRLKILKLKDAIVSIYNLDNLLSEEHMNTFRNLSSFEINLSYNLNGQDLKHRLMKSFSQMQSLQKLKISMEKFDFEYLNAIPNLNILKVVANNFEIQKHNMQNVSKLSYLRWNSKHSSFTKFKVLFDSLENIRKLCFLNSPGPHFEVLTNTSLEYLELFFNFYDNYEAMSVVNRLPYLRKCKLTFDFYKIFSKYKGDGYHKTYNSLKFQDNYNLKVLKLRFDYPNALLQLDTIQIKNFIEFITSFKRLAFLKVHDRNHRIEELTNMFSIAIPRLPELKHLKLISTTRPSHIDNVLPAMLQQQNILLSLDLKHRDIDEKGFTNLIEFLSLNKSLRTLKVSAANINIVKFPINDFFKAIKQHPKLTNLNFKLRCQYDLINKQEFITYLLDSCKALKELILDIYDAFIPDINIIQTKSFISFQKLLIEQIPKGLPNLEVFVV